MIKLFINKLFKPKLPSTCVAFFLLGTASYVKAGDLFLDVSTGPNVFSAPLLSKTAQDFFGDFSTGNEGSIEANDFLLTGRSISLGWRTTHHLAKNLAFSTNLSAGFYRFSQVRVNGVSVFTDPTRVKVSTAFVDFKVGVFFEVETPLRPDFFLESYAGLNASASHIAITSEVLNVRNSRTAIRPYFGVRATVKLDAFPKTEPWISAQVGGSGYREVSLGIRHNF